MNIKGVRPVLNNPLRAKEALERDLPKALRNIDGWQRLDDLNVIVPQYARNTNGEVDNYLLKLNFAYYPQWPPSAQFVNPETLNYLYPADIKWLPKIEGTSEIAVHASFQNVGQLICNSMTLEFYQVNHGVEDRHLWNEDNCNFSATINVIKQYINSNYYKGRQGA